MKIDLPLTSGITLQITSGSGLGLPFPTGKMQKGLLLFCEGHDLSEEGVGFGVPILKRSFQSIFPSEVELSPLNALSPRQLRARYRLNLVERISRSGNGMINNPLVNGTKDLSAALIRRLPILRNLLTNLSNSLRSRFNLETIYEPSSYSTYLTLNYSFQTETSSIRVELAEQDLLLEGISDVIIMNEQGAISFDEYQDSDGAYEHGSKIGCWDPVFAPRASFISSQHRIGFSLPRVEGARLYRGRELIGSRLAWSGFGYSFPPTLDAFSYEITIQRFP